MRNRDDDKNLEPFLVRLSSAPDRRRSSGSMNIATSLAFLGSHSLDFDPVSTRKTAQHNISATDERALPPRGGPGDRRRSSPFWPAPPLGALSALSTLVFPRKEAEIGAINSATPQSARAPRARRGARAARTSSFARRRSTSGTPGRRLPLAAGDPPREDAEGGRRRVRVLGHEPGAKNIAGWRCSRLW
jgi:hypothetical protein